MSAGLESDDAASCPAQAIRGLKDERAKAKEREEGKGCVEDSPLRVKFLEAELAKVSEDLQWAEHVQQAAACAESAAVHKAKALETKLGLANEVGFISVYRRHAFVFAYIKRALQ